MKTLLSLLTRYREAFRDEPKLRAYALASFVDDVGIAVSAWAMMLLATNLFTTQRARASLMLPSLVCCLAGTIVSGPLADWVARGSLQRLARWRWRLVVWARLVEAILLVTLLVELAVGPPTIARVLPFVMVAAFTKTAFRPTRVAYSADLLTKETLQVDAAGQPRFDEQGQPLRYKTHFLALTSLVGTLSAVATLIGLLLGGRILSLAAGRYWQLFLVDAVMRVGFVAVVFLFCHPSRGFRRVGLRELVRDVKGAGEEAEIAATPPSVAGLFSHFGRSLRDGLVFLRKKEQRPLLLLLAGAMLIELVTEAYDGRMIIKHVLHGTDDALRHAELAWSVVGVAGMAVVPALARAVGSIGRIFLVTMLLDGLAIAASGYVGASGNAGAIVPFTIAIAVDHSLTLASSSLVDLAQNSSSSAAMRGRIAGVFTFFVIVGDMIVEAVATPVSEAIGIPSMLVRIGLLQVGFVTGLALVGGRRLWRFGLFEAAAAPPLVLPARSEASS
jgi:hypothetical protein